MSRKLMGKKKGMLQLFDETGRAVPCTVIEAVPSVVTQIKNSAGDGYDAIQLGFSKVVVKDPRTMDRRLKKPQRESFKQKGLDPMRHLYEVRVDSTEGYELGQEIGVSTFSEVAFVDVVGTSKGKGYQGVMKLHGFHGGPAAHGSGFHRHAGSTGMRSTPGICFKGGKRPSHMGNNQVTIQSLPVVRVDEEHNLIIVKGSVPGPCNGLVFVQEAVKKSKA
ncbi:MAG: 50S ribosomal protein L3 [Waddliaceae bacterium]|nr:50S ribosomal protein L3 [Waddliaceae bacterium]